VRAGDEPQARLRAMVTALGRVMSGTDPTDRRFRQHLADQLLRGVATG
jgi:hypothetical protein